MPRSLILVTAAALAATLGSKSLLSQAGRERDIAAASAALGRMAAASGYRTRLTTAGAGIPLVVARRGDCQRRLFILDPMGSQTAKVMTLRRPGERAGFHYRGAELARFPRFEPVARHYAQAYLDRIGIGVRVPAIIAELSSGPCERAPRLPLAALGVAMTPATG